MLPPKQKVDELFRKVSSVIDLKHNEILEFLLETKIISDDLKTGGLEY